MAASSASLHSLPMQHTGVMDYNSSTQNFNFPNPSSNDTMRCGSVPIVGDTIAEPCEAFSAERSRIVDVPNTDRWWKYVHVYTIQWTGNFYILGVIFMFFAVIHFWFFYPFLADIDEFLLFNNSPQIVGTSLTVDYTISGCAQVLCQVPFRTTELDCEYHVCCWSLCVIDV